MGDDTDLRDAVRYLRALVFLQIQSLSRDSSSRPEVLLDRAGFAHKEIAVFLGKSVHAISKSISRYKKNAKESSDGE